MLSIRMIGRNEDAQVYGVQQAGAAKRGFILVALSDCYSQSPLWLP